MVMPNAVVARLLVLDAKQPKVDLAAIERAKVATAAKKLLRIRLHVTLLQRKKLRETKHNSHWKSVQRKKKQHKTDAARKMLAKSVSGSSVWRA